MKSPALSTTAARIRPPVFGQLQLRVKELLARGGDLVPLHIGDTYMSPPAAAMDAMSALDGRNPELFRYGGTQGTDALRGALAEEILARRGLVVDAERELLVGAGGTHALACVARATLDPGDEVLMLSPYWPLAPGIVLSTGAVPVEVSASPALYRDASFDLAAALRARLTPRTKAVYFVSPNNPDGKILSRAALEQIAAVAEERDLWVFADEVYADHAFDAAHVSFGALDAARGRTVLLYSLSKSHALAGCRVGYAVAPEPVVAAARRVSTHSVFNVPVGLQRVAVAALGDATFVQTARDAYRAARDVTAELLRGAPVRFSLAEGATYLFLDLGPALDALEAREGKRPAASRVLEAAVDRGVLLAPGDAFGDYPEHARLCYTAVPEAELRIGVGRLVDALAELTA